MIHVIVLGAAAGGGFPQWNSNAERCRRARSGDPDCLSRTQVSLAVSQDRQNWFLLNASPDLRQQILSTPALFPSRHVRSSPIRGVVLTGAEVDTVAGLLSMRERQAFRLHATESVLSILEANPIFEVLARDLVPRIAEAYDAPFPLCTPDGAETGLQATLFAVPGKVPLYLEQGLGVVEEDNAGIEITDGQRIVCFVPGCARMTPALRERLNRADLLFFDATLWDDEEMITAGLGPKTGRRMGHMPVNGPGGTLSELDGLAVSRKIFVHLNNSNPLLDAKSPERAAASALGWEVAHDGLEISL